MKSKTNANNIYRMDGIGKVFVFTLKQTFKNKAYLFSFVFMIIMMALMGPISMLSAASSSKAFSDSAEDKENLASTVYYTNDTVYDLVDALDLSGTSYEKLKLQYVTDIPELSDTEIGLIFTTEEKDGETGYVVKSVISDDSKISSINLEDFTKYIYGIFEDVRIRAVMSDDEYALASSGVSTGKALSEQDFYDLKDEKISSSQVTTYATIYSIAIMILVSMSVSYVISSVMEEKTSKLVENLLVSVRPLALIMGKVFAMMVYVVSMLLCGAFASGISSGISAYMFGRGSDASASAAEMAEIAQQMDYSQIFGLNPLRLLALFVSLIITYLMFSIIAGLMGSACTKTEDVGPTIMVLNMFSIAGYICAFIVPNVNNKMLTYILSVVPFISSYIGPISFACERIPFWLYLIGMAVQLLFILLLFRLTAKVYRKLLVNDSKKLNFAQILRLSREGEA
jgi:ABC-type Na+ efflux pump permease subunit